MVEEDAERLKILREGSGAARKLRRDRPDLIGMAPPGMPMSTKEKDRRAARNKIERARRMEIARKWVSNPPVGVSQETFAGEMGIPATTFCRMVRLVQNGG